jgi:DNA-binding PadR family transcriptional regulator
MRKIKTSVLNNSDFKDLTITITYNPTKSIISVEEFVLGILSKSDLYVHKMFHAFNEYRDKIKRKHGKYSSFRAVISSMKKKGLIISITQNRKGFEESEYRLSIRGKARLDDLRGKRMNE